jgi:hypothetical protein
VGGSPTASRRLERVPSVNASSYVAAVSRVAALDHNDLPHLEGVFTAYDGIMGFVPDTVLRMARVPGLVGAYAGVARAAAMNALAPTRPAKRTSTHAASIGPTIRSPPSWPSARSSAS